MKLENSKVIGIIGGSGLEDPDFIQDSKPVHVATKYGDPTSSISLGKISGRTVAVLPRHGRQHQFSPTQVNYRANLIALQKLNVSHIFATTACGSLRYEIERGDLVFIDQFIDFTKHRISTYHESFEKGIEHTIMAEPFNPELRKLLYETAMENNLRAHNGGTLVTIEGPRFSTKAESKMFKIWGADVINMSVATEAALANELGIPYAAIAMSTDYDCWKEDEEPVTWQEILEVSNKNASNVKDLLIKAISKIE